MGPKTASQSFDNTRREVPVTRPYFDLSLESSDEEFAAEAPRHPVFRLISPPR